MQYESGRTSQKICICNYNTSTQALLTRIKNIFAYIHTNYLLQHKPLRILKEQLSIWHSLAIKRPDYVNISVYYKTLHSLVHKQRKGEREREREREREIDR